MSWLVSSIANSLKLEDDDDEDAAKETDSAGDGNDRSSSGDHNDDLSPSDTGTPRRGVKEDLSEFSKTFTRQFWGVASFLAPPTSDSQISDPDPDPDPQSSNRSEISDQDDSGSVGIGGIRSDLSEIGGRFRTGISKLSNHKAVSEFTKIASEFIQFVSEEGKTVEDYAQQGVVGITDEVVAFAREVATHPETWIDFPMPDEDEEEDFDMSDIQQEHALAVERLAPALAALRMELCPRYMPEASFWKVYFKLVHPRLAEHDAELLSTSQVARARETVTQELRSESNPYESGRDSGTVSSEAASVPNEEHPMVPSPDISESVPVNMSVVSPNTHTETTIASVEKHVPASTDIPVTEDNKGKPSSNIISKGNDKNGDEDGDEWLKEEPQEKGNSGGTAVPIEDDDISFSDLEEEDGDQPTRHKNAVPTSESNDNNDWLDIEDIDAA